jgi:hypothetical protein
LFVRESGVLDKKPFFVEKSGSTRRQKPLVNDEFLASLWVERVFRTLLPSITEHSWSDRTPPAFQAFKKSLDKKSEVRSGNLPALIARG